ncbi:tRNA 2'-phosphotransferase 1-like [Watersipora subatra]|uniref:tRNA 2'-phosphotransferase 1-like n=1 Tax=Watersipora subatra TaxID=2589382 RepID=UPI00355C4E54
MASKTKRSHQRSDHKAEGHNVKLSKLLSYTLRHGAEKEGLTISDCGFVSIADILSHSKFRGFTFEDITKVVEENDKQRFSILEKDGSSYIRANQGHSIPVPNLDIVQLKEGELPFAIHGTYDKCINTIKKMGLSKMKRQHIHMAVSEPGESGVISGMRKSCDYIVTVDIARAQADGLKFFRSANNVILTEGDENGLVLPKYFHSVKPRTNN